MISSAPEAVDRDDSRVLESAGHFGFQEKPRPTDRIIGVLVEDLLERDLAVKLAVQRDEDSAQTTLGVGSQDAESLSIGRGRADAVCGGGVGVITGA